MSIQVFCPFLNWVVFFDIEKSSLYILDINTVGHIILSHLVDDHFVLLIVSLAVQKIFSLYSHLFYFVFLAWGDISPKILLKLVSKSVFSSKSFRSYIDVFNLVLIFFRIWSEWSSLILLCVAVQFSQYHLLKRLSFPHCCRLHAHIRNESFLHFPLCSFDPCVWFCARSILFGWL